MSLGSSLQNALSGLRVASKSAELISSNVANALTPGYARRELSVSANTAVSGGVKINAVTRHENLAVLGEARVSSASVSGHSLKANFFENMTMVFGEIGSESSLSQDVAQLSSALLVAQSQPQDETRLASVVNAASGLVNRFHAISDKIQGERQNADHSISLTVEGLNRDLKQLERISHSLQRSQTGTSHHATQLDTRNQVLDRVAQAIPIKVFERPDGSFAVYSTAGSALMDIEAAEFSFESTPTITATTENLGALFLNGEPIANPRSVQGGELGSLFEIRDVIAPKLQQELDQFAFSLAASTQSADPDGNGIFLDRSQSLNSSLTQGFSSRISIAEAIDPSKGGDINRLRTGTDTPVLASSAAPFLTGLTDALGAEFMESSVQLVTKLNTETQFAIQDQNFAAAYFNELTAQAQSDGVNTDNEMQHLLQVERAYAANAKVLAAVDELLDELLRIG